MSDKLDFTEDDIKDSWNEEQQKRIGAFEEVDPKFAALLKKYENTHDTTKDDRKK